MKRNRIWEGILSVFFVAGISVLCFLPAIIWLLAYLLLSPEGFWQKAVIFGLGLYLLGGLQIFGLILFVAFWIHILTGDNFTI